MSSAAESDSILIKDREQGDVVNQANNMDSSHADSLPAEITQESGNHHADQKDDAATMAASEELKHTTISDNVASSLQSTASPHEPAVEDNEMNKTVKETTPERDPTDAQDEEMKDKLTSPKKKRGRETYDEPKGLGSENIDETGSLADGTAVNGNRLENEGPEKKRHRDTSEDPLRVVENAAEVQDSTTIQDPATRKTTSSDPKAPEPLLIAPSKATFGSSLNPKSETSATAFASSGFSSLAASSTSPFGTMGASKPSVFGGNTHSTTSGFGALPDSKSPSSTTTTTTSGFGGLSGDKPSTGFGFGSSSTSGFGGLGKGSVFGSALGNGFASGSGPKLSSFAAPGKEATTASKPAKAFGAPESDEEDGSDEEGSDEGAESDEERETTEEKKKAKISKVPVHIEDGESGEATLLQLRAKLFALESKEAGWKERGVGTLKINVPKPCASFDENGLAIPGSFDASGLEDEEEDESIGPRVPRLIMRQENTHRVVLNTIIVRAMEFKDKPTSSAAQIIFTAFEGEKEPKPVNMLFRMSETNARLFKSEIQSIQHEL